jgi:hypothetical protein
MIESLGDLADNLRDMVEVGARINRPLTTLLHLEETATLELPDVSA